jgi:hypothetical protein
VRCAAQAHAGRVAWIGGLPLGVTAPAYRNDMPPQWRSSFLDESLHFSVPDAFKVALTTLQSAPTPAEC